jgi:hypothetical protein
MMLRTDRWDERDVECLDEPCVSLMLDDRESARTIEMRKACDDDDSSRARGATSNLTTYVTSKSSRSREP